MTFKNLMGMFLVIIVSVLPLRTALANNDSPETPQTVAKSLSTETLAAVREILAFALSAYDFGYVDIIIHEKTKDMGVKSGPLGEDQFEGITCYLTVRFNISASVKSESCYRVSDIEKAGATIRYDIFNYVHGGEKSIP